MLRIVLVYPRKMPVRASERIAAERWAFGENVDATSEDTEKTEVRAIAGAQLLEMIARFREQVTDGGVDAEFATKIHADVFTNFMSETMKTKPTVDEV
jgi:hypothetical protein